MAVAASLRSTCECVAHIQGGEAGQHVALVYPVHRHVAEGRHGVGLQGLPPGGISANCNLRREGDSNPRGREARWFSRPVHSSALPSLQLTRILERLWNRARQQPGHSSRCSVGSVTCLCEPVLLHAPSGSDESETQALG